MGRVRVCRGDHCTVESSRRPVTVEARQYYTTSRSSMKNYVVFDSLPAASEERTLLCGIKDQVAKARVTKFECLACHFIWGDGKARNDRTQQLTNLLAELGSHKIVAEGSVHRLIVTEVDKIVKTVGRRSPIISTCLCHRYLELVYGTVTLTSFMPPLP